MSKSSSSNPCSLETREPGDDQGFREKAQKNKVLVHSSSSANDERREDEAEEPALSWNKPGCGGEVWPSREIFVFNQELRWQYR